jgi:hypothetical protein
VRRLEGGTETTVLDRVIATGKIDGPVAPPEGKAHVEEFRCPRIAFVMLEEITVVSLLQRRISGHHIERDTAAGQCGQCVDLLNENRRRLQAGAARDNELDRVGGQAERGGQHDRVGLGGADVNQKARNPEFLGETAE